MTEPVQYQFIKMLPGLFLDEDPAFPGLLGKLLAVWEAILIGTTEGKPAQSSLKHILEEAWRYFELTDSPPDFIDWLAVHLGLLLQSDWDLLQKKRVIADAISIYRKRGTKEGLEEYLNLYVVGDVAGSVDIIDFPGFQVGVDSVVGIRTVLATIDYFCVNVNLPVVPLPGIMKQKLKALTTVINREKPVQTNYEIKPNVPTMQIGVHSKIGIDTLLWEAGSNQKEAGNWTILSG